MRLPVALLLLCLFACAALAQTPAPAQIFRGTIGTQPVVVKLERTGDKLSGSYVYERIGQDIKLTGQIDAQGQVTLAEFDATGRQTGKLTGSLRRRRRRPTPRRSRATGRAPTAATRPPSTCARKPSPSRTRG